ncbi:hypothetical protein Q5O14_08360 [Eubacteriaceae bacterium ES2]|nr:hypothetical protein Q5O14_08360 [Eubacteriaceae bacterium ES2]
MSNEPKPITPSELSMASKNSANIVQQTGEKNVYASRVNNMNITIQNASVAPQLLTQNSQASAPTVDRTHYNLFVTYGVDFSQDTPFTVEASRALTEYMDDDLKEKFSTLSDDVIDKIKTFPCIFANENFNYGHTDEEQTLGYGYIRQIKLRRDGIKIYPQIVYLIPQQRLNEALFDLDIRGCSTFNEFNRMHWSIKKIDLITELQELGFQV